MADTQTPGDFKDMTPGTVFEFDQPGFGPATFVWNGREGIEVPQNQAEQLASLPAADVLKTLSRSRTQLTRLFGARASAQVNKDFSRVTILSNNN